MVAEVNAYDHMSICYYYKCDLNKAKMYMNRYLRGITEANFSRVKTINII